MDKIRVDKIIVDGIEQDSCPFRKWSECKLNRIPCRYGLTDVRTPSKCPLRSKILKIKRISKMIETDF